MINQKRLLEFSEVFFTFVIKFRSGNHIDLFWLHAYRKIMQKSGGFPVFMYRQSDIAVDIDLFTA